MNEKEKSKEICVYLERWYFIYHPDISIDINSIYMFTIVSLYVVFGGKNIPQINKIK